VWANLLQNYEGSEKRIKCVKICEWLTNSKKNPKVWEKGSRKGLVMIVGVKVLTSKILRTQPPLNFEIILMDLKCQHVEREIIYVGMKYHVTKNCFQFHGENSIIGLNFRTEAELKECYKVITRILKRKPCSEPQLGTMTIHSQLITKKTSTGQIVQKIGPQFTKRPPSRPANGKISELLKSPPSKPPPRMPADQPPISSIKIPSSPPPSIKPPSVIPPKPKPFQKPPSKPPTSNLTTNSHSLPLPPSPPKSPTTGSTPPPAPPIKSKPIPTPPSFPPVQNKTKPTPPSFPPKSATTGAIPPPSPGNYKIPPKLPPTPPKLPPKLPPAAKAPVLEVNQPETIAQQQQPEAIPAAPPLPSLNVSLADEIKSGANLKKVESSKPPVKEPESVTDLMSQKMDEMRKNNAFGEDSDSEEDSDW